MAVSISPLVRMPLYNGAIAGSGKIYVYLSGTSTPVTTYNNAALTVANTNPIITDDNGEAIIYVATGQALRMLFTTSGGATIRDIDPIYIDPILTNLTASVSDLNLTTTYLSGITPGTTTASKALVVDSNKRMDVLTVGTLSLGAGAGTAITASATELNKLTGCTAVTADLNKTAKLWLQGANLASAATTDLSTVTGDFVTITGTTTITSFGTLSTNIEMHLRFSGALTLTYNATSLILPTAASITTAAGDTAIFRSLGSGNWLCIAYQKADGTALVAPPSNPFSDASGIVKNSSDTSKIVKISAASITTGTTRTWTAPDCDLSNFLVQRVSTMVSALVTGTTTIPYDDTIPQNTEGVQFLTQAITPKKSTNILVITAILTQCSNNVTNFNQMQAALFQDSTANAIGAVGYPVNNDRGNQLIIRHIMTAGTTSSTTFNVRGGSDGAGTTGLNGTSSARRYGGVFSSSITVEEFAA